MEAIDLTEEEIGEFCDSLPVIEDVEIIYTKETECQTDCQKRDVSCQTTDIICDKPHEHRYVARIKTNLECGFCKNVLTRPMQLPCGHRFCEPCLILNEHSASNPANVHRCAVCRTSFVKPMGLSPDIAEFWNDLPVPCPNFGEDCKTWATNRTLNWHLRECDAKVIYCPSCEQYLSVAIFEDHVPCYNVEQLQEEEDRLMRSMRVMRGELQDVVRRKTRLMWNAGSDTFGEPSCDDLLDQM